MALLFRVGISTLLCSAAGLVFVASHDADARDHRPAADRSTRASVIPPNRAVGKASAGRDVFRFETFGNEKFWTDAMRMPKGILDAKVTPIQALKAGLMIDVTPSPRTCRKGWRRS
jgi:hypothetical protein